MARGTLYQLSTSTEMVFPVFDEEDFYEQVPNEAEYFQNMSEEDSSNEIKSLKRMLKGIEAEIGSEEIEGHEIMWFRVSKESRRLYFKKNYELFRQNVSNLWLDDFIDSSVAYKLRTLITGDYEDAVILDGSTYIMPLDTFFREIELDEKYYISPRTIYMK